jgi:hypothetical protein
VAGEVEVCKILATIDIALISVSITAYAIAISVLGSGRARLQAQIDDIYAKADERFRRGEIKGFEAAQKEVVSARAESKKISTLLSRLSLFNVVLLPGLFFTLSILVAVQGILEYPRLLTGEGTPLQSLLTYYQYSAFLLVLGVLALALALFGIEKAAGQPRPVKVAIESPEGSGLVAYYFVDFAETKIVVDWNRKVAYWFDARVDKAAREGKIKLVAVPGKTQATFAKDKQLSLVPRAPTPEELPL